MPPKRAKITMPDQAMLKVRLTPGTAKAFKSEAEKAGQKRSDIVRLLVASWLEYRRKPAQSTNEEAKG